MNTTSDLKNMENEEKSFIFLGKFSGVLYMENVSYGNSLKPQVHWFYTVWGLELLTPMHLFVVPFVMETCRHWDFFLFDLMRYLSRVFSLQNTVPFIFFLKGSIEVLRVPEGLLTTRSFFSIHSVHDFHSNAVEGIQQLTPWMVSSIDWDSFVGGPTEHRTS